MSVGISESLKEDLNNKIQICHYNIDVPSLEKPYQLQIQLKKISDIFSITFLSTLKPLEINNSKDPSKHCQPLKKSPYLIDDLKEPAYCLLLLLGNLNPLEYEL